MKAFKRGCAVIVSAAMLLSGSTVSALAAEEVIDELVEEAIVEEPVAGAEAEAEVDSAKKAATETRFAEVSLSLGEQLGVNFKMEIKDSDKNGTMTFTVDGVKTTQKCQEPDEDGFYVFTCEVPATKLASPITAVYSYGDGKSLTKRYSVQNYLSKLRQLYPDPKSEEYKLADAIQNYGHYAESYFAEEPVTEAAESDINVNAAKEEVGSYALTRYGDANVTVSYFLDLDSKTAIYIYIKANEKGSLLCTIDDKDVKPELMEDGRYRVCIDGIAAKNLGDTHTVEITLNGKTTMFTNLSALSYANTVLNGSYESKITNLTAALNEYYNCSRAYALR